MTADQIDIDGDEVGESMGDLDGWGDGCRVGFPQTCIHITRLTIWVGPCDIDGWLEAL